MPCNSRPNFKRDFKQVNVDSVKQEMYVTGGRGVLPKSD